MFTDVLGFSNFEAWFQTQMGEKQKFDFFFQLSSRKINIYDALHFIACKHIGLDWPFYIWIAKKCSNALFRIRLTAMMKCNVFIYYAHINVDLSKHSIVMYKQEWPQSRY